MIQKKEMRSAEIKDLLEQMSEQGEFLLAVLSDMDGLPLATVSNIEQDNLDNYAAVVALLQRTARQVKNQLEMGQTDEIMIRDDNMRLVCRPFHASGEDLLLSVVVPGLNSYRQLTNTFIRRIMSEWKL
jgi:predicted regulator of Ras-like GTPase activity (Roadblock/LC7/MglB family)